MVATAWPIFTRSTKAASANPGRPVAINQMMRPFQPTRSTVSQPACSTPSPRTSSYAAPAMRPTSRGMGLLLLATTLSLSACGGAGSSTAGNAPAGGGGNVTQSALSAQAQLGEKIFHDTSLSVSGQQSCATCHDPAFAHAQNNALPVQFGGARLDVAGFRAVPSLRYLHLTPAFGIDKEGTASGGFDRDGRAASLAAQAQRPFVAAHEMGNADAAEVVARLQRTPYAEQFRSVFGAGIFSDVNTTVERMTFALQQFQKEDPQFHPYDAKYDLFLAGKVSLSPAELRGLSLFNDKTKGNCAACHPSSKAPDGSGPLFTDFSFDALGVPRNTRIPATADASYADLGLCGPDRTDLSDKTALCGQFKVPTLRNVATRKVFFHNGQFTSLREALRFYVQRDTNPERWYPLLPNGEVDKFNDLPAAYRANVNISEAPYNRQPGMAAALNEAEIEDLLQFLGTLTDGYRP